MLIKSVTIKKGFAVKEHGGEFCVVNEAESNNGTVVGMPSINETGIFLWERITQGDSTEALIEALMKKHNIEYEDAYEDVGEFLAKLINGNIVNIERS